MGNPIMMVSAIVALSVLPFTSASAMPMQPVQVASPEIVLVAGGCGPYRHRGPYGGCRLNRGWVGPGVGVYGGGVYGGGWRGGGWHGGGWHGGGWHGGGGRWHGGGGRWHGGGGRWHGGGGHWHGGGHRR